MPPITGRAIGQVGQGMGPGMNEAIGKFMDVALGTEIIYAFVIIACSLIIYFATKELYELSSHKGIKYFRQAFLFFALAYFFRSFIKVILLYLDVREIRQVLPSFGNVTLFIFMYFSAMAIFYLLYSVVHKKYHDKINIFWFHLIALVIALISVLIKTPTTYLILNLVLFAFIAIVVYIARSGKKKHNLYVIYILLSVFWIFNILDILIPDVFQNFQLFIYLISIGIFLTILYKVSKKIGS